MANPIGARQCESFKAVSTAPSINRTPVGNSRPPLPYPTVADLSNSLNTAQSVRFNGKPAYVLDQTTQPTCKGDEAGSCGGVKSGTVNGVVKPLKGAATVRVGGKPVVRQGDPCTMNGGNNPGIYVTTQVPSGGIADGKPSGDSDPPIRAETAEEESWLAQWWARTKHEVGEAAQHPWEAAKGALKGIGNVPSDVGEMVMKGAALHGAGEMEQAAALQGLFGQSSAAETLSQTAQAVRAGSEAIELPRFPMSNPAQAGGDKVVTAASLLAGGAGLLKNGIKSIRAVGAAEGAGKELAASSKTLQSEKAIARSMEAPKAGAAKAADVADGIAPAGSGVKVRKPLTNHEKAAFGERTAHGKMTEKGYEPMGKTDGIYEPGKTGIDGVYRNPNPPPDYIITEVKYGSSQLEKNLADGTNQMDDLWVMRRLRDKVGFEDAIKIENSMEKNGGVEKWLIRIGDGGGSKATKINSFGSPIRGDAGRLVDF